MNGRNKARVIYPLPVAAPGRTPSVQTAINRPVDGAIHSRCATLQTLTVLIPLFYNPDNSGVRKPIEAEKMEQTFSEIKRYLPAYLKSRAEGWWPDPHTGEEFFDELMRFEIDDVFDARKIASLKKWKLILERRFEQREMYFKLSAPCEWL